MLPLAGSTIPDSAAALVDAVTNGLARRGLAAREVIAKGPWPALDMLWIDLTGMQISRSQRLDLAHQSEGTGFTAAHFELAATPADFEGAPIEISMRAEDAAFGFSRGATGELLFVPCRAAHGQCAIEITASAIERLVHSLAAAAAREHGVEIKSTRVTFLGRGPRALSLVAEVTAKVFIASTTIEISGNVDLDERLDARLSALRFSGEGMIAGLAGSFIRPQLARLEGRSFPLMSFALGEMRLRDVQLQAGESLRITAQFGS
jgi:hypothetical protein